MVTDSGVAIPNQADSISAAKDQPLEIVRELRAIKEAIVKNGGKLQNATVSIRADGLEDAITGVIEKVTYDKVHGFAT